MGKGKDWEGRGQSTAKVGLVRGGEKEEEEEETTSAALFGVTCAKKREREREG